MSKIKTRELKVTKDPSFYQYTDLEELEVMNTSELTIALKVLRKEQRRLTEKCYRWGKQKRSEAEDLDVENVKLIRKYRPQLEQILFGKQGYVPRAITDNMLVELGNKKNNN
ncbi:hypothetical protein [Enterococcus alishanensis]